MNEFEPVFLGKDDCFDAEMLLNLPHTAISNRDEREINACKTVFFVAANTRFAATKSSYAIALIAETQQPQSRLSGPTRLFTGGSSDEYWLTQTPNHSKPLHTPLKHLLEFSVAGSSGYEKPRTLGAGYVSSRERLALAELRGATRLLQARLLAFDLAAIAGQQT